MRKWKCAADGALEIVPLAEVIFQSATPDELAAHEATIAGLDKAAKGQCIWSAVTAPPAPA
jgi:DNA polymerase-3 subunit epsilon